MLVRLTRHQGGTVISSGRYVYHLQDIAEIKAKPQPLDRISQTRLTSLENEVATFEEAHPEEAKAIKARAS